MDSKATTFKRLRLYRTSQALRDWEEDKGVKALPSFLLNVNSNFQ